MVARKTILVVEADPCARRSVCAGLQSARLAAVEAADREAALRELSRARIDLVTLGVEVGAEDGVSLVREIKTIVNVPVVIVSGDGDPMTRVAALEQGADDYVVKPFDVREIVLRVQMLLGRSRNAGAIPGASASATCTLQHAIVDLRRRELRRLDNGATVSLTHDEIKLLELFLRHPAEVITRDEIQQYLRGREWSPLDRTIDSCIARLRRKVEPCPEEPRLIRTVRGVGYVFVG